MLHKAEKGEISNLLGLVLSKIWRRQRRRNREGIQKTYFQGIVPISFKYELERNLNL